MATNALIQIRVDESLKREADALFSDLGLDTPTAIRMFLKQSIHRRGLPFDVIQPMPTDEARVAMEAARTGTGLIGPFQNAAEGMASLMEDEDR